MRVSPSQISTARTCLRKWHLGSVLRMPRPAGPGAELGTQVHGHLEAYLRDATPVPGLDRPGRLAQALVPLLPPPRYPGMSVEVPWSFSLDGLDYSGRIDWIISGDVLVIGDHKTTSDFQWSLSSEALTADPQGVLYGAWALKATGRPTATLAWNYVRTRGAVATLPVRAVVTPESVEAGLEGIVATTRLMRRYAEATDPLTAPPSPDGCSAYGGCPFRAVCSDVSRDVALI